MKMEAKEGPEAPVAQLPCCRDQTCDFSKLHLPSVYPSGKWSNTVVQQEDRCEED